MNERTVPRAEATLPVRTVSARVIGGPDVGASATADRLAIGSDPSNDLALSDPTVSRFHLELASGAGIRVRDHASTNGCFVGALRITDAIVPAGTQLRLGDSVIEV